MADHFTEKIRKIRIDLETTRQSQDTVTDDTMQTVAVFSEFRTLSETVVAKLIKESATKSLFILDHIPTWILKQCLDVFLPVITLIIKLSLSTCVMPDNLKEAILIPLLRKALLNPDILNNFRPISNLAYISKLAEQVCISGYWLCYRTWII